NQWISKELSLKEIDAFHEAREITSVKPVAVHDSYLINLASPLQENRKRSSEALLDELMRADRLNIPYVVMHPGAHRGDGEKRGIGRISEALNRILDHTSHLRVKILLETTAGQGTSIGYRFEQLAEILERTDFQERLGVCLDTCHVFAAGYDFGDKDTYEKLIRDFDTSIGLSRLKLFHVNDSKKGSGSRIDRHEHIGQGLIGEAAFSFFLNSPLFKEIPFLLETPKGTDEFGTDLDLINLGILRHLMEE
ncbi:MAG: deoxyribonuclease IV, partial [Deltaproteobacteria bacterium]|nr:deoxyribonuclease IV [Deltaproteobacteria bacterium]